MHNHHKYIFYPIVLLLSSCELALATHPLTQRSFEHFNCVPNCILPFVYFNPVQLLCGAWISKWVMLSQIAHCHRDNDNDMSWRVIMVLFRMPGFTRSCSGYFSGIPDEMPFFFKTLPFHYQCIVKATGRTEQTVHNRDNLKWKTTERPDQHWAGRWSRLSDLTGSDNSSLTSTSFSSSATF